MIIVDSTMHLVIPHDAACLGEVLAITQASSPIRSFLLVEIDDASGDSLAVHWQSEHLGADGYRRTLHVVVAYEHVHFGSDDELGYSENSFEGCSEHELAASGLARFGLPVGLLAFEATRTLRVWRAAPASCAEVTPVAQVYEQVGLHYYSWMHPRRDQLPELFPPLDGNPSVDAW